MPCATTLRMRLGSAASAKASSATQHVTENISGVNQAATETGSAAGLVLGAADQLTGAALKLRSEVESFLAAVKAA